MTVSNKGKAMLSVAAGWTYCPEHPESKLLCPICDADEMQAAGGAVQASDRVLKLSAIERDKTGRLPPLNRMLTAADDDGYVAVEFGVHLAYEAQALALSEVAADVQRGQISPAKREAFTAVALSNIDSYRAIVENMEPMVDLREYGHAGDGNDPGLRDDGGAEAQVIQLSTARAERDGISYPDAMRLTLAENTELTNRWRSGMRKNLRNE